MISLEEDEGDKKAVVEDVEEEDDPEAKFQEERQRQLREAAKSLLFEPDSLKDEDYDTDLEEEFHEGMDSGFEQLNRDAKCSDLGGNVCSFQLIF